MRLDINLASQPYEDAREFWLRWGTALAGAIILTLALVTLTITGWYAARRDHAKISELEVEIAQRDRTRAQAEAYLNQPENRSTRDQSQFLNELIERKSFSWTRVLEDLEKVMPARVHLISIHPELDEDNQLGLKMYVGGDSRDKAIELARRMEESHRFTQTHIDTENVEASNSNGGDTVKFNINAIYVPEPVTVRTAKAESSKKTESPKGSKP
jgi:type IV pilus assembly protein PilN